jgi:hypothetical protein
MDNFVEIKYGTIIYNDGTISKTTIYNFNTVQGFRTSWENRSQLSKAEYQANVKELTIQCREFVDATEYLNSLGEEE